MKRIDKSLDQRGVLHYALPLLVIVLFAIVGVGYLVYTHAATPASTNQLLSAVGSNICLDDYHSSAANGSKVDIWQCNKTKAQDWSLTATATTAGTVINANGLCLDVVHSKAIDYTPVDLTKCNGTKAQRWTFKGGVFYSALGNSSREVCLDVYHAKTADGDQVEVFHCNGTVAQKWTAKSDTPVPKPVATTHWLMTNDHLGLLLSQDPKSANWFFNSPDSFSMGGPISGLTATPVKGYKSYTQFATDIAANSLPAATKWVLYDNESWSDTPKIESQHPASYMKQFADLAHQHGLKVIETPARDLMDVAGADCAAQKGESADHAYIRCSIPQDARYADIYEIQAQADQPSVTAYQNFVLAAKSQLMTTASPPIIMAGLTTDRGDSAAQIYACWQATHMQVSGYWMNTTTSSFSTASQVLDTIRGANMH